MASDAAASSNAAHPAPHRERVGLASLMFGLGGAPIAWAGQEIVDFFFASHSCYPGSLPRTTVLDGWDWAWSVSIVVNVAAIVIALAAAYLSWSAWHLTKEEHEGGHEHLVEIGEGRSRFLAICGLITSVGFLIAILFAASSFWVPLCGH